MNCSATAAPTAPVLLDPGAPAPWVPISDSEIDLAALQMNSAGMSAGGGGARLLSRLLDPALDLDALSGHIAAEPGLAIRLMRVANSPFYGQAGRVDSIARAAQVVGLRALRGIAAASCFDTLVSPQPGSAPLLQALRLHSLAVACAADALATLLRPAAAPQAFMAGLLHDLGILVQWRLRPRPAAGGLSSVPTLGAALAAATGPAAGSATHAYCGRRLVDAWGLPTSLSAAIALHGQPVPTATTVPTAVEPGITPQPPATDLPLLLAWSDRIATASGFGLSGDDHAAVEWPAGVAAAVDLVAAGLPLTLRRLGALEP